MRLELQRALVSRRRRRERSQRHLTTRSSDRFTAAANAARSSSGNEINLRSNTAASDSHAFVATRTSASSGEVAAFAFAVAFAANRRSRSRSRRTAPRPPPVASRARPNRSATVSAPRRVDRSTSPVALASAVVSRARLSDVYLRHPITPPPLRSSCTSRRPRRSRRTRRARRSDATATFPRRASRSLTAFVRSLQPYGNPVAGSIARAASRIDASRHFATTDAPSRADAPTRASRTRARAPPTRSIARAGATSARGRDGIETESRRNRHERAR